MIIGKYKEELNTRKVQEYIDFLCDNYTISRKKVTKMLIEERKEVSDMEVALEIVVNRLEYMML